MTRHLFDWRQILSLHSEVQQLASSQKELDTNLESIKAQQNDLDTLLSSLEEHVSVNNTVTS